MKNSRITPHSILRRLYKLDPTGSWAVSVYHWWHVNNNEPETPKYEIWWGHPNGDNILDSDTDLAVLFSRVAAKFPERSKQKIS